MLGALYVQMGNYTDAEKYLTRATALNPSDLSAWLDLGGLHLLNDRIKETIAAFRGAVAVDPASELPHCDLAKALVRGKDLVEAERVLQNAIVARRASPLAAPRDTCRSVDRDWRGPQA
jgi:Flp pilus assembly protein TadD